MQIPFQMDRTEIKLFLVFLFLFTMFISWGGDNAWSRYNLAQAMVEDRSLEISEYSHNTMDKISPEVHWGEINESEYWEIYEEGPPGKREEMVRRLRLQSFENASVIYTDKAPMSSFLAVPAYILGGFFDEGADRWMESESSDSPVELSFQTVFRQFLMVFALSVLPGALLLVLVYRYLQDYVDVRAALYTAVLAGISTPLMVYSTSFFGVITAAFFGFLAYIVLQRSINTGASLLMYVSGILSALAFATEYYASLLLVPFILYLFASGEKKDVKRFIGGVLIGSIPLLLYNWFTTGNPLKPPLLAADMFLGPLEAECAVYVECYSLDSRINAFFIADPVRALNAAFRLLFFPTRGLFFYAPILLLAIPGTYELYKRNKKLLILFPGVFLLFLLFQASQLNWLAGVSFGPRYTVVGLPFLILPVALGLEKMMEKGRTIQIFVLLTFLFSVFGMLLGFNAWHSIDMDQDEYSDNFHSFSAVQPEFYPHLVSEFKEYGPQSEVMMSLTGRYKGMDITREAPYGPEFVELGAIGDEALLFSTNLVPVMLAVAILTGLLWRELEKLRFVGIGAIVLLILASISTSSIYAAGETYRSSGEYFDSVNGSVTTIFYADEREVPHIEVFDVSQNEILELNVAVNGNNQRTYEVRGSEELYFPSVSEGRNEIKLESRDCQVPALHGNSSDTRCLSFGIENMSLRSPEEIDGPVLLQGWHDSGTLSEEGGWMREEAGLAFYSDGSDQFVRLNMTEAGYLEDSDIEVSLNGERAETFEPSDSLIYASVPDSGWNELQLEADRCVVPAEKEDSDDERCLSYLLESFSTFSKDELPEKTLGKGWHGKESDGRWMEDESEVMLGSRSALLNVTARPYHGVEDSELTIYVNGEEHETITPEREDNHHLVPVTGRDINYVRFRSREGCITPAEYEEDSTDERCLSFKVEHELVESLEEKKYLGGWYEKEEDGRWMANETKVVLSGNEDTSMFLQATPYSKLDNPVLKLSLNGEILEKVESDERFTRSFGVGSHLEEGVNILELESVKGCKAPVREEAESEDNRCLSFMINSLEFDDRTFLDLETHKSPFTK